MEEDFIATASTTVNAPAETVWKALTDRASIKEYMFGTDMVSDFKKGCRAWKRGGNRPRSGNLTHHCGLGCAHRGLRSRSCLTNRQRFVKAYAAA